MASNFSGMIVDRLRALVDLLTSAAPLHLKPFKSAVTADARPHASSGVDAQARAEQRMGGVLTGATNAQLRSGLNPHPRRTALATSDSEKPRMAPGLLLPTTGLIQKILDEYGLKHVIDEDGDLAVRWEQCSLYFFHYGQYREVLQARLYLNRRFPVEARAKVALALDDWNRTKLFPKAYTVLPDDGLVGICGEQCHDFEVGVAREQLKYTIGVWVDTLMRFAEWVDEHVWLGEELPGSS